MPYRFFGVPNFKLQNPVPPPKKRRRSARSLQVGQHGAITSLEVQKLKHAYAAGVECKADLLSSPAARLLSIRGPRGHINTRSLQKLMVESPSS